MEYIRALFYNPWVPLVPLFTGLFFVYTTSKYSFIKNVKVKAAILGFSPLIMLMIGLFAGSWDSSHGIHLEFGFLIGISFMGLLAFYNLRIKQLIVGTIFMCLYLYFIFMAHM